ncbi:MAG: hypothetical protein OXE04_01140 [bacterium]|nr:hypothetical protein [bacterium]MCY4256883.1 hypothetical protein [bacterium]
METALTALSSVTIALFLGGFAWLRSDIVRLSNRVDDLSNRVAKIEGILEERHQ